MSEIADEARFAVDTLCKAYFSTDEPMKALSDQFIAVRTRLTPNTGVSVNDADPARIVIKLLMCFLRSLLVTEYNRLGHDDHRLTTNVVCENKKFVGFADAINDSNQYIKWTHIILSIISALRLKSLPVANGVSIDKSAIDVDKMPPGRMDSLMHVYDNARLMFYGLLLSRLSSVMFRNQSNARERFNIEVCLFMTIIFFYSDYVQIQKDPPKSIAKLTLTYWKALFGQVNVMYLPSNSAFFTQLKLGTGGTTVIKLKSYLSQDTIGQARDCLTAHFLHKYRKIVLDVNQTTFDLTPVRSCLNNMQGFRMRMSRWFRNKIKENVRSVGISISDGAGKIYKIANYAALFAQDYPVVTVAGSVAFALAAYNPGSIGNFFASAASAVISAIGQNVSPYTFLKVVVGTTFLASGVRTAWVFVYTDPDLQREPDFRKTIKNETVPAKDVPYLELVTSPNGDISTIYRVAPLPRWYDFIKKKQQSNAKGWDMPPAVGSSGGSGGIPLSRDVQQLKEAFDRGYIRDELPEEMQRYIRKRTNIIVGTPRRGGAASKNWQNIDSKEYGDDIPAEFIREKFVGEGSNADPAVTIVDGATVKTWVPHVDIQTEMLKDQETGFAIDIPDPADDNDTPSELIMTRQDMIGAAKNLGIPVPPVLPDVSPQVTTVSSAAYYPDYARRRASYGRLRSRSRSRGPMRRALDKKSRSKPRSRSQSRTRSRPRRKPRIHRRSRSARSSKSRKTQTRRRVRSRSLVRHGTARRR